MAKHFTLKRLMIGLLLFCGVFAYASFHKAAAGGIGDMVMETFCGTWTENMEEYSGESGRCWSCDIFMLFFNAANKTAGRINATLSGPIGKVVIIGVALYVVFNMLVFFSSVNEAPNTAEFITKIGTIILKAGIAYCFFKGGAQLAFDYIINPVLASSANLASQILDSTGTNKVSCRITGSMDGTMAAPIGAGVGQSLECMIKKIASGMARSQTIASGLRCGAFFWLEVDVWFLPIPAFFIPNPLMWVTGIVLGCLFWIVSCMFPMAMLDVIFRIGLTVGMLPLFIAAWIFPITASYAKTAWNIFFHSCMVFAITGIVVCMVVMMVETAWVAGESERLGKFQEAMEASSYVEAWDMLFNGGLGQGLARIFIVLCIAVWGLYVAPLADKLSGQFIGAADFPKSVAIQAIRGTINFILDVINFIITIITFGATSCLYFLKGMKHVADGVQKVEELKKKIEKVREFREKMRKIQERAQKVQKGAQAVTNVATGGQ